jgi:signal transduction histidine kinase
MQEYRAKGKLRNRIFLMMALVGVLPVLIAAVISIVSLTASHKNDVATLEGALIDQKYTEIKSFMDRFVKNNLSVLRLRFDSVSTSTTSIDPNLLAYILKANITGIPEIQELSLVDLSGKETMKFNKAYPGGVPDGELSNVALAEEFTTAKSGKDYVGPLKIIDGEPTMILSTPVLNKDGALIAVYMGTISLESISLLFQNTLVGESGYLYLVDGGGRVIASGITGPASSGEVKDIGIVKEVVSGTDFLGSDGQRRYENYYGKEVVAAGKFLPEYQWGLIAEWPAQEADAILNQTYERNGIILLVVLAAVIFFSVLLAMFIVRPVRALEQGAERVATGKFDEEVAIRTGDELEELGFHFNKMMVGLKQLEELKNEFVFIAAHELRTPVAAMKGYLALILEGMAGPITDKTKDFIEKVMNSNQRLIQLVNDLLEVSRSEGGKLVIKVAPIDIVEPVRGVLAELQSLADKATVQLVYAPSADLPKAMADSDRLKEVMVNLVGNSIKYMGGPGKVTISHEVQGKNLVTRIADTGLGMSKEAQAKLFEKFYRVQTEKTQNIQGTGLGLFIVKEIVEKMNGRIWAESEGEGKGSTFSFSLPTA